LQFRPPSTGHWDLPDFISANPSLDAWTPTPAAPEVHLPVSSSKTSAFPTLGPGRRVALTRTATSVRDSVFGAAVIRFASGLQVCLPPRSLLPIPLYIAVWQPWLIHSSNVKSVTSLHVEYASRPNRAIDGRGLSPLKIRSLVGCSPNTTRHRIAARFRIGIKLKGCVWAAAQSEDQNYG